MKFGLELFTFSEAREYLSFDENRLYVAFSKLHSKRILHIFNRGKPRLYRVLDPENFLFLTSGVVRNVEKIASERYLKLVLDCLRFLLKTVDLESFAVYGSVARGSPSQYSDVDILLVSDSLEGSLASRIEKLCCVEEMLEEELRWLRGKGVYTSLSFYPLRRDEARRLPLLFLDLTEEAAILYDRNGFFENVLLELKEMLLKQGAKRVMVGRYWYWDLKPNYRFSERVDVT
jgi:predicted nucleotidyltransferase